MRRAAAIAVLPALTLVAGAQPRQVLVDDSRALGYTRALTDLGPRLTGTAAYRRAAEWAAAQLRAAGVDRVGFEPFQIPDGWEREAASGHIVFPERRPLRVAALGWTPSTPPQGVDAEVVAVDDLATEKIAALTTLGGRIALLPPGDVGGNPATATTRRRALDAALRRAGALAILAPETDRDNNLAAHDRTFGASVGALPAAQIAREDAETIRALLGRGPVRVALDLQNRVTPGPIAVDNLVAEIDGRDIPDEWVVVGAHLDSWDMSAAAQDNATGVAMVIDAARAISVRTPRPRRSIRFVLWGGEEQGQLGSNAYVAAHRAELDRFIAYLNSDAGTGRQIGWTAPGRADVVDSVRPLVAPLVAAIGGIAFDRSMQYAFQSDGAAFVRAGVPLLDLNADDSRYEEIHHKKTDTLERVDASNLAVGAAIVAATAVAVAEAPKRLAPRLDRHAVGRH